MFPDSGGQYIYLREAYGDLVAFLYGWMLFAVANGGTIAALSVASAAYMGNIVPWHFAAARDGEHPSAYSLARSFRLGYFHVFHARACGRAGADRHPHLRQRFRTALGRASPECLHLDEVHRHGSFRCPGIRHRQGTLVELQRAGAGRFKPRNNHGTEPRAIDLRSRRRLDRRVLGLRRLGLHHVGRRRSEKPAAQCAAGHGFGRARGGRDLSRHEPDLRLRPAAE